MYTHAALFFRVNVSLNLKSKNHPSPMYTHASTVWTVNVSLMCVHIAIMYTHVHALVYVELTSTWTLSLKSLITHVHTCCIIYLELKVMPEPIKSKIAHQSMYTHAALFFRVNVNLNLKSKIAHHPCTHMLHCFVRINVNLNLKSKIAHHPCTHMLHCFLELTSAWTLSLKIVPHPYTHMPALFEYCLCAYMT